MRHVFPALALSAMVLAGCASKEEPATQAVAAAEASLNEVRADAQKFTQAELAAADAKLASLKADLAKEKYKEVLLDAPALNTDVKTINELLVAKKTQMAAAANEWEELLDEVPDMVSGIESRVDELSGSRLPKEVTKEAFEAAKTELQTLKSLWAEAKAAYDAGKITDAADKGRAAKTKAEEVMPKLFMAPV